MMTAKPTKRTLSFAIACLMSTFMLPVQSQININKDGKSIQIGPGGIQINDGSSSVHLGNTPSKVKIQKKSAPPKTVRAPKQYTAKLGPTLPTKLTMLEQKVYGKDSKKATAQLTFLQRVEKLEKDTIGHPNGGSIIERTDELAKHLGVSFGDPTANKPVTSVTVPSKATATGIEVKHAFTINNSNHTGRYDCKNSLVTLNGSNCHLVLTGVCNQLIINGSNNQITSDTLGLLVFNGSGNKVTWHKGAETEKPAKVDNGSSNLLRQM